MANSISCETRPSALPSFRPSSPTCTPALILPGTSHACALPSNSTGMYIRLCRLDTVLPVLLRRTRITYIGRKLGKMGQWAERIFPSFLDALFLPIFMPLFASSSHPKMIEKIRLVPQSHSVPSTHPLLRPVSSHRPIHKRFKKCHSVPLSHSVPPMHPVLRPIFHSTVPSEK